MCMRCSVEPFLLDTCLSGALDDRRAAHNNKMHHVYTKLDHESWDYDMPKAAEAAAAAMLARFPTYSSRREGRMKGGTCCPCRGYVVLLTTYLGGPSSLPVERLVLVGETIPTDLPDNDNSQTKPKIDSHPYLRLYTCLWILLARPSPGRLACPNKPTLKI